MVQQSRIDEQIRNTFFSKRGLMRRAARKFGLMSQSDWSAGNGKDDWATSY
jgi:hypothetical protein